MISYNDSMTKLDDTELIDAFKQTLGEDDLEASYRPMRDALKKLLERTMVAGVKNWVQADRFERTPQRQDQRNGFYHRGLLTNFGFISQLAVPRVREGTKLPRVFTRYRRRAKTIDAFIRKLFLKGTSTREVGAVMEELLEARVSASTVSQVCKVLDAEVRKFHRRQLQDEYRFLFLDGVVVKVRAAHRVVHKVMLVAYGIKHDRTREIIGFHLGNSENRDACEAFLLDLQRRGLTGERLQMITIDGGKGLRAGVELVYPHVALQRCWVHKLGNVSNKLKAGQRKTCLAGARAIYQAANRKAALRVFRQWAGRWRREAPKAVQCLEADLEELLTFYTLNLDQVMRPTVRTTNAIERRFRDLRKRIRPMGAFANSDSCERIIYALFQSCNDQWQGQKLWQPKPKKKLTKAA